MKLLAATILALVFAIPTFAQKASSKPVTQSSTGPNSPNISNVAGDVNVPSVKTSEPVKAAPTAITPEARELAITKVKLAIANARLAQAAVADAQKQADQQVQTAQAIIVSTQKQLGLDDTYEWNWQAQDYVKKVAPAPAAPAK